MTEIMSTTTVLVKSIKSTCRVKFPTEKDHPRGAISILLVSRGSRGSWVSGPLDVWIFVGVWTSEDHGGSWVSGPLSEDHGCLDLWTSVGVWTSGCLDLVGVWTSGAFWSFWESPSPIFKVKHELGPRPGMVGAFGGSAVLRSVNLNRSSQRPSHELFKADDRYWAGCAGTPTAREV